jgi:hypothetical protein
MPYRRRRFTAVVILVLTVISGSVYQNISSRPPGPVINGQVKSATAEQVQQELKAEPESNLAGNILETLPVKGRAPKTGYKRSQFGQGWADIGACNMREHILGRDLTDTVYKSPTDCTVVSGTLVNDPYTAKTIAFVRGPETSDDIQIEHIVALSDAWQKGAQQLSAERRVQFANDPLNLLAVDGPTNNQKGDADAASWLPPNKAYRCRYIARQIAVKKKYGLWVTEAERNAMRQVLAGCPKQEVPTVSIST